MGLSMLDTLSSLILNTISETSREEWKVLVLDEDSRKVIDNVVQEDKILDRRIAYVEHIEIERKRNPDTAAIYILSPLPHIVDCLVEDLKNRQYGRTFLFWTSILPPQLRERVHSAPGNQEQIALYKVLNVDFYPRESHLVTLRDPYSFPVLYHPACSNLVKNHIANLAQRIVAVCVALGEYPTIRYYRPKDPPPTHESSVLCFHIATAVQNEIDAYAQWNQDFPPPKDRTRGALYILDRSLDLFAPFVHEFTYQAMAHDLLPVKDGDKVTYRTVINEGKPNQQAKDMEIGEKDKIWVENRHRHMKDTIEKLMSDFQKFMDANPHFTKDSDTTNLNAIKDMLAGLPQFQEMKEAYSLHLSMAQDCMNEFQNHKLPDLAALEQTLATGLDEDYRKPKNIADQLVRMLDEDAIILPDRLRLIGLYVLSKDGLLNADINKLLLHARLPGHEEGVLRNLELLGARVYKALKDSKPQVVPIFPPKQPQTINDEGLALSRFEPALKTLLDEHVRGTLDPIMFPYTKPDMSPSINDPNANISSASLRSAKPTWARAKLSSVEPRQRVIVFMAGGATYSEARSCYEVSEHTSRDVVLMTSHMLNPGLWLQQLGDLSQDRRRLRIPADLPAKKAPAHLYNKPATPVPASGRPGGLPSAPHGRFSAARPSSGSAPVAGMAAMSLNGGRWDAATSGAGEGSDSGRNKDQYDGGEREKKKKHHFFGSKR